jgi:hypothetical protein
MGSVARSSSRRASSPSAEKYDGDRGAREARGLEADSGAAADEDDGLPEQLRPSGHERLAICGSMGIIGRGFWATSMRSAITAVS